MKRLKSIEFEDYWKLRSWVPSQNLLGDLFPLRLQSLLDIRKADITVEHHSGSKSQNQWNAAKLKTSSLKYQTLLCVEIFLENYFKYRTRPKKYPTTAPLSKAARSPLANSSLIFEPPARMRSIGISSFDIDSINLERRICEGGNTMTEKISI